MNITVVGGGNVGTQFAVHCAEKLNKVTIFTSKPDKFYKQLTIVNEKGKIINKGDIVCATYDCKEAFANADIIFITMPAYCMKDIAEKILPYIKEGVKIGLIPGTGGGECAFREGIEKGAIIFGFQRVPSVARLVQYGKSVCAMGYRKELHIAAIPNKYSQECCDEILKIFDIPCTKLPNYLNVTLTPSNPILHTTRLKTIFKDYSKGVIYDSLPLFYEEWDDESSKLLLKCDNEVQKICKTLDKFDLSYVKSLRIHYESKNERQLTNKISSIQSFKGLKTPNIEVDGRYIPDLNSRYFIADFSYGLSILLQIAEFINIEVPNIKETLQWYRKIEETKDEYSFANFGINNLEEFIKFYSQ